MTGWVTCPVAGPSMARSGLDSLFRDGRVLGLQLARPLRCVKQYTLVALLDLPGAWDGGLLIAWGL